MTAASIIAVLHRLVSHSRSHRLRLCPEVAERIINMRTGLCSHVRTRNRIRDEPWPDSVQRTQYSIPPSFTIHSEEKKLFQMFLMWR